MISEVSISGVQSFAPNLRHCPFCAYLGLSGPTNPLPSKNFKESMLTLLDLCVSSLRRGMPILSGRASPEAMPLLCVHSWRFPDIFGDFCKNKTSFLRVFMDNRFLPCAPVDFREKPEPVPCILEYSLNLRHCPFCAYCGEKPSLDLMIRMLVTLVLIVHNYTDTK